MPEIFDVAKHFDDIAITDGYTSAALWYAQISTFLGSSPDGSVAQKRVVSTAPDLVMPARRVITALGETYVVGSGILDGIYGRSIRKTYWTKLITDTFQILTPAQACLGSAGTTAKGRREYLKDLVNNQTDAEYDPFWEIFLASTETVAKGTFLKVGSTLYRARSVHLDDAGFTNAASDQLDAGAGVSVTFTQTGAFDPITETYASGSVTTAGILLDRYKLYEQLTEADALNKPGDMSLIVAASAITPLVGRNLSIASRDWEVLTVTAELDAWHLHIRRA